MRCARETDFPASECKIVEPVKDEWTAETAAISKDTLIRMRSANWKTNNIVSIHKLRKEIGYELANRLVKKLFDSGDDKLSYKLSRSRSRANVIVDIIRV